MYIVGYTLCGPTYIESFLTIFGQCISVLNYNQSYQRYIMICTIGKMSKQATDHCSSILTRMIIQLSSEGRHKNKLNSLDIEW